MGLKLIPPVQGRKLRDYYIRFEGSMYGMLHVDNETHTVSLVPLNEIDNVPVFIEPLDPYKLYGVRVFEFPPVAEGQETNPWRTLSRSDDVGAVRFLSAGGRRRPGPGQYADTGSLQAV